MSDKEVYIQIELDYDVNKTIRVLDKIVVPCKDYESYKELKEFIKAGIEAYEDSIDW